MKDTSVNRPPVVIKLDKLQRGARASQKPSARRKSAQASYDIWAERKGIKPTLPTPPWERKMK